MSAPDGKSLAQLARKLQLLSDDHYSECLPDIAGIADPADAMRVFERRGYLTTWQTAKLLKGEKDGYVLGGYRILYRIAAGSFGRVFRGDDPRTGDIVAIKVLRRRWSEDAHKIELFEREGKVGMTMNHPNIVRILNVSKDAATGQHFIVMEFVEGGTLRDFLAIRKKLEAKEAVRLLEEMASGLAYAFSRGLTHRDLKPSNVLISAQRTCKLVDFGLAEITGEDESDVGRTVDYAGLERATGAKAGDVRSDIYFLGCIFYEMLAGRPPLAPTKDKNKRMHRSRFESLQPLTGKDVDAPAVVFQLLDKMLALDPSARYQTPAQLHDAVRKVASELDGVKLENQAPVGPWTVFIIEQNQRLQDAFREKFKEVGYRVLLSPDPARAVQRYTEQPYHALIVDAGTSGEEGMQALQKIVRESKSQGLGLATVLILNEEQAAWAAKVAECERVKALVRPVTLKQLYTHLNEMVAEFAPR